MSSSLSSSVDDGDNGHANNNNNSTNASGVATPAMDRSASTVDFNGAVSPTSAASRSLASSGAFVVSPASLLPHVARPSNLPAKSVAEEKKHALEVAKMVQLLAQKRNRIGCLVMLCDSWPCRERGRERG